MTHFLASSAKHLRGLEGTRKRLQLKRFASGEMHIIVPDEVAGKDVWLVGSVLPDTDSLIELLVGADLLKSRGATVRLVIPYLAYARQDKPDEGGFFAASVICRVLQSARFDKAFVIDVHNQRLRRFFRFENVLPLNIFYRELKKVENPLVVAPDEGGIKRARAMASLLGTETAYIQKKRMGPGKTKSISLTGQVTGCNAIIVDDIIDSGGTIIGAARLLQEHGANNVYVAATHGVFSMDAVKRLEKSPIKKIIVTNTLSPKSKSKKIKIIKIEPEITAILQTGHP